MKKVLIILGIIMICATSAYASVPPPPGFNTPPPPGYSKPKVPLDGGLAVLMLGAVAFGVRKLRKH